MATMDMGKSVGSASRNGVTVRVMVGVSSVDVVVLVRLGVSVDVSVDVNVRVGVAVGVDD